MARRFRSDRGAARAPLATLAILALSLALTQAGCGSSSATSTPSTTSAPPYPEVLRGLKHAATMGRGYHATQYAPDLDRPTASILKSFCRFAWEIKVNREAFKLDDESYVVRRVRGHAFTADQVPYGPLTHALAQLREVIDLGNLDAAAVRRYTHACYR